MNVQWIFYLYLTVGSCTLAAVTQTTTTPDPLEIDVNNLKQTVETLGRQVMLQQLFVEERVRAEGNTGIKQLRSLKYGTRPFQSGTITESGVGGAWDNILNDRLLSIVPNSFVMNGVEFLIPGQNYKLQMPSKTSTQWQAVEDIPFPDVPPSILHNPNVTEQIQEMQLYFKAFISRDIKIKADYANFFKPVLCYLEGWWSKVDQSRLNTELSTAINARKISLEGNRQNTAFDIITPTTINSFRNGTPEFAKFKTRIVCHPVNSSEVELLRFYPIDDLASRIRQPESFKDYMQSRHARFGLHKGATLRYDKLGGYSVIQPQYSGIDTMDRIMTSIPGLDNHPSNLRENSFNETSYEYGSSMQVLNTGYYFRQYKSLRKGAMGTTAIIKGFSDVNMWVAQTSSDRVAGPEITECKGPSNHKTCFTSNCRFSYAIPLEIVWLTPLLKWNPYKLAYTEGHSNSVRQHGRNGHRKPYNGTDSSTFIHTPYHFYTHAPKYNVLDTQGHVHDVAPSGISTVTPEIANVGHVRLRYPIVQSYHEGNAIYKEIDALKALLLRMSENVQLSEIPIPGIQASNNCFPRDAVYATTTTTQSPPGVHFHEVFISPSDYTLLRQNNNFTLKVETELSNSHVHDLVLKRSSNRYVFDVISCDGQSRCWDGHDNHVWLRTTPKICH